MNAFNAELIGTITLILLGNGVVANVVLNGTKGQNSGWIVITFGWAMAVFAGVFVAQSGSKAHLNPAVTLGAAALGDLPWGEVAGYISAQFCGAFIGSTLVWMAYKQHFDQTTDAALKRAVFCTAPAIRHPFYNTFTEALATFVLVFGAFFLSSGKGEIGSLQALPVALLVLGIGLCLGGPTGYAINPARDLGPRIMHALLPIRNKEGSDWSYAWVPVIGPVIGALLAALALDALGK